MSRIEQLLAEWEEGALGPEGIEELKGLLATPEARAELVGDLLFYETVYGTLRAGQNVAAATAPVAVAQPVAQVSTVTMASRPVARKVKPVPVQSPWPWLVWREVTIPLRWWLGAGIAAGLVLGAFWLFQPRATVQIYPEQGNSVIKRGQQQWLAKSGQGLKAGDWLRVSADGSALVKWRNEATEIELGSNTEWRLQGLGRSKALVLNQGMMRATVAPQAPVGAMTITTPHAEARVLGTCFTLDVAASATRLEVLTGTVELRKRQPASAAEPAGITVGPGQSAVAAPGVALVVQPFTGGLAREIRPWTANPLAPTPGLGILAVRDTLTNFIAGGWPNPFDRERTNTYRQRISGCLIPPATGVYYFWIASENSSELWLSTDQNPGHRRRIAFVPPAASTATASGPGINLRAPIPQAAWQKFPNQKSAPQRLKAGVRYYVEVAHQLRYGDAVMVGWAKSDASANVPQEIVPGTFLAPVPAPMAAAGNKTTP